MDSDGIVSNKVDFETDVGPERLVASADHSDCCDAGVLVGLGYRT